MRPIIYSLIIFLGTIIFWANWVIVLLGLNPNKMEIGAVTLFFLNLFLALVGTIYIVSYLIRSKIFGQSYQYKNIMVSTRQAFLFSVLLTASLWLQSQNLLTWYNIVLLIVGLTVLEFFFISRQSKQKNYQ